MSNPSSNLMDAAHFAVRKPSLLLLAPPSAMPACCEVRLPRFQSKAGYTDSETALVDAAAEGSGRSHLFVRSGDSMLVILAGLPGTGKSTLCHALAAYAPGAVLNKDAIRHAVFGPAYTDYSRQQDDLCGSMMLAAAEYLLRANQLLHVYLDGRTFSRKYQLRAAIDLAERLAVPWRILHCSCSDEVAKRRLKHAGHLARNRSFGLYKRIQANFEPIAFEHLTINTDLPLKESLARAVAYLGLVPPSAEKAVPE